MYIQCVTFRTKLRIGLDLSLDIYDVTLLVDSEVMSTPSTGGSILYCIGGLLDPTPQTTSIVHTQQLLGGEILTIVAVHTTCQPVRLTVTIDHSHAQRMDKVLFIGIARRKIAVGTTGDSRILIDIHTGVEAYALAYQELTDTYLHHLQFDAIAIVLLARGSHVERALVLSLPHTGGMIHKRVDAHLLSIGLAHTDHRGVGIHDLYIVRMVKVEEIQGQRLQQFLTGRLLVIGNGILIVNDIIITTCCEYKSKGSYGNDAHQHLVYQIIHCLHNRYSLKVI